MFCDRYRAKWHGPHPRVGRAVRATKTGTLAISRGAYHLDLYHKDDSETPWRKVRGEIRPGRDSGGKRRGATKAGAVAAVNPGVPGVDGFDSGTSDDSDDASSDSC